MRAANVDVINVAITLQFAIDFLSAQPFDKFLSLKIAPRLSE
jgi:hypothetical protein